MKKFIKPLLLLFMFMVSPGWAASTSGSLNAEQCFKWLGNEKFILGVYFNNNESNFPTISGKNCQDDVQSEINSNKTGKRVVLLGGASGSGKTTYNTNLAKQRINTVKQLFDANTDIKLEWNGSDINTVANLENEPKDRVVYVLFIDIDQQIKIDLTELEKVYALLMGFGLFDAERSVWKDAQGEFNTARLASDSIAGVVLGTVGGVVTSSVMKKHQVEDGFEDLKCTIGGQTVAGWGDEFNVGIQ